MVGVGVEHIGFHEFLFILFFFLTLAVYAALTADVASFGLLLLPPALGGRVDTSERGEKRNEPTDSLGENGGGGSGEEVVVVEGNVVVMEGREGIEGDCASPFI